MIALPHHWLTIAEAAPILRISERTLYKRAAEIGSLDLDGRIPVLRIGRQWRIPAGALDGYFEPSVVTPMVLAHVTPSGEE